MIKKVKSIFLKFDETAAIRIYRDQNPKKRNPSEAHLGLSFENCCRLGVRSSRLGMECEVGICVLTKRETLETLIFYIKCQDLLRDQPLGYFDIT